MAPPYNTPGLQLEEMALDSVTPDEADVFLLSSTRFAHESTSFLDCVIEGNGRNEGTVHFITYRALHAGRTALIGRISSSLHSINPPDPCSPLIGQNLIAVSSHYMENSMPYLACLPVGGASLVNDDVMRGGGAAEIGMWRKQVR